MDISTTITLGCISIAIILWYIWRKRRMTLFERLGIPGPKPHLIRGNVNNTSQQAELSLEWAKKYGKIYGIYMGAWPFLVVSDVEFLKLIQIKDAKAFAGRAKLLSDLAMAHPVANDAVFAQVGEKWKNSRSAISPAFTTGKLKKMMPIAMKAIDIFLEKIAEKKQKTFDIVSEFRRISFDINSRASFGFSTGIQHNENTHFIRSIYRSFDADSKDLLAKTIVYFPEFSPLPQLLRIIRDRVRDYLSLPSSTTIIKTCKKIIAMRNHNPEAVRQDLLQGLLDASTLSSSINNDQEPAKKGVSSHVPLTEEEVLGNSLGFMLAGFDAISVILSFCIHYLVDYPEIQDKLRKEINEKVKGKLDYDDLNKLPYLDQVIAETLRLFPFSIVGIHRVAAEDYKYNGMTVPKDTNIGIALYCLNMDPEYWKDPEEFRPERFSPENGNINPAVYQPFGNGPRNCVGMRFAQVVMKTIIVSLLQKYKLENPPDAEKFELEYTIFLIRPKHGIQVRAIPVE